MRTFFAPAHITGFFDLITNKDPMKTGSRGAGVVLDKGMETGIILKDADRTTITTYLDGNLCDCKTTKTVVKEVLGRTCGAYKVEVHHFSKLPVGYGFGLSASGALSTAYALNHELSLDLDLKEMGGIAHLAEVKNKTGMGDVSAELSKGLVIRTKEGAPDKGRLKSLPIEGHVVSFIIGDMMLTKDVLENNALRPVINTIGGVMLKKIQKNPSPDLFLKLSRRFTLETGLAEKRVETAIHDLDRQGITAGMCMLGNTVFTITDEPDRVKGLLDYPSIVTTALE